MNEQYTITEIQQRAIPLSDESDLDSLMESIGDAKYVLLGEASHGTSEFYTWRADISKRLINEKGFNFIAVEGDWPSCYEVNRYIKNYADSEEDVRSLLERAFSRWPSWMWANSEIVSLVQWLRDWNQDKSEQNRVGFYGLDVYSLWESMENIIHYLEETGSSELEAARKAFSCFEPYSRDPQVYGMNAAFFSASCEEEVVQLLLTLQNKRKQAKYPHEAPLSAEINALVAVNGEKYYRSMVRGGPESWNIRDHHMVEALNRLMSFHGKNAKAIIWEHNTHIGDARATDMVQEGMVNVGQLLREQNDPAEVFALGFATHHGSVIAAKAWGDPLEVITVPPAQRNSWEDLLHQAGTDDKLLLFDQENPVFQQELGHRAIGVVYHPQYERFGNYVPTVLSDRYDGLIYLDETHALHPLVHERILSR